ncbi:hypothetical protein ACFW9I_22645 [[Kitasatospora] papulosa]|uniref:hypothetical protein n=1 Tax=[Kitasatospora] papulosa TaxID=1464011 RepID=UPI00367F82AA
MTTAAVRHHLAVSWHRLVEVVGHESSRYLAQDAEDLRARAEAMARKCGAPPPAPRRPW